MRSYNVTEGTREEILAELDTYGADRAQAGKTEKAEVIADALREVRDGADLGRDQLSPGVPRRRGLSPSGGGAIVAPIVPQPSGVYGSVIRHPQGPLLRLRSFTGPRSPLTAGDDSHGPGC
jgi:hypothetical protein